MLTIPGYSIARQIHDGRRSLIFQGTREIDNLPVIIKTLKNKFPSLAESLGFQQEYSILQNAGPHGIVRAYCNGNHTKRQYDYHGGFWRHFP